ALAAFHDDLIAAVVAEDALGFMPGQTQGRHALGVVDPARNDRAVRVSLLEFDNDLLPHVRNVHSSPVAAAPVLRNPDPAGTVQVLLTMPIPVELDLDPSVLVRVNGFPRRTDDDGRLGAFDHRLLCDERGPKWQGCRDAMKLVLISKLPAFARAIID